VAKQESRLRHELTVSDLQTPIWEFTLREKFAAPNEGRLRPRPDLAVHDHTVGNNVFTVRAAFQLADGSHATGICSPVGGVDVADALVYLQPAILTALGQVHFWLTEEPTRTYLDEMYARLGRSADDVFPLRFHADVPLSAGEIGEGLLNGFAYVEYVKEPLGGGLSRGDFRFGEVR
jgi:hypothetical protein